MMTPRTKLLYRPGRFVCRMFFRLFGGVQVFGKEHLPAFGAFLICANHTSLLDPPAVGVACPLPVAFLAKLELFRIPVFGWLIGALQSIPGELYEAARVDGATRWQQFRAITLPSLKPALIPAIILSVVWTFNMFNIPYLVTAGQPGGSTEILITQAYKFAFEKYRYGYAAAYSTVIFGILLIYGTIQNRATRATEGI